VGVAVAMSDVMSVAEKEAEAEAMVDAGGEVEAE
jgi:hypothetical protein